MNLLPLLCDGYDATTGERCLGFPRLLYPHEDGVLQWGVVEEFGSSQRRVLERVVLWWPAGSVPGEGWLQRAERIRGLRGAGSEPVKALRITKGGHPAHPLYLPGDLVPVDYGQCP